MTTYHILTQYIWPDSAPTGLYAEHLAVRLQEHGEEVCLVGGNGKYRTFDREGPALPLRYLEHYRGRRGSLGQTFVEYASVKRAFDKYIVEAVKSGDVVVVTSAPPSTVQLAARIKERGARAIYWLQDYYPELLRGVHDYPSVMRTSFRRWWDHQLARWDTVVKIGANLGGVLPNSCVIRNWPTITFGSDAQPEPHTALYLGNLGYGHDVALLVRACEQLRDEDYAINIWADGPGVGLLPTWLKAKPARKSTTEARNALLQHQVHLIAGHPKIQRAIFPSKIWNSLAAGRDLVCTGFEGAMLSELNVSRSAPFSQHLDQWLTLLLGATSDARSSFAAAA